MDKQQKLAIVLLPILAVVIIAGFMTFRNQPTAEATGFIDGRYVGVGAGFYGDIKVEVEIVDGKIAAIQLLEIEDTPGLGDTAAQFVIDQVLNSHSLEVDVYTGATVSSQGTIEAIEDALAKAKPNGGKFPDGIHEGSGEGFYGDIRVKVEVVDGKIVSIEILEISDTPGLGDAAAEDIIAQIINNQSLEVDVYTGATKSSEGLLQAVKVALGLEEAREAISIPVPMTFVDGIYEGTGDGAKGEIKVRVEVLNGRINSIEIIEISDTPNIGDKIAYDTISKIIEFQSTAIDALSGATVSSQGTIDAIINALNSPPLDADSVAVADENAEEKPQENRREASQPAPPQPSSPTKPTLRDGTYVGEAEGYNNGTIRVSVTIREGKIFSIEVLETSKQTPGLGDVAVKNTANQVVAIGITLDNISEIDNKSRVDGLSGATESTDATRKAIKAALEQAR